MKQKLDMTTMLMAQVAGLANRNAEAGAPKGKAQSAEGSSFDDMLRAKQEPAKAENSPSEKADASEKPVKPEKAEKPQEDESTEEQMAVAAGLIMEIRPEIDYSVVEKADTTVEAPVELIAEDAAVVVETAPETVDTGLIETVEAEAPVIVEEKPVVESEKPVETVTVDDAPKMDKAPEVETKPVEDKTEDDAPEVEIEVETPVFADVKAAPVKVADTQPKVELEAPEAPKQIADIVAYAEDAGMSRVEITLTPENLGKLTVEITRDQSGVLSVVVNTTSAKAAMLLEKHSAGLEQLLAAGTKNEVRVEVQNTSEAPRQFLNPNGDENARQQQKQQGGRHSEKHEHADVDFLQRLRLGLVNIDGVA